MSFKLSRRSVLKGLGVALPLPFLNVMATPTATETSPKRFVSLFKPNGVHPPTWAINNSQEFDFEFSALMQPLQPHKEDILVLENMGVRKSGGHAGANFLCGVSRPSGASMDQVLADHIGRTTPVKSLELTTEGIFTNKPDCSYISYDERGRFMPRESDPQIVFDKLFRNPFASSTSRRALASVLDGVKDNAAFLSRRIGHEDRHTLDEFFTMVRQTEKKIESGARQIQDGEIDIRKFERPPAGGNLDEQVTSMLDIIALALWTDSTRVTSFMLGNDNSRLIFDFLGITEQHHYLSHFFRNFSIGNVTKLNRINLWHVEKYAYLINRLKAYKDGEGTLLDNTIVHYGSGMGHSDIHSGAHVPNILAGGKGLIRTGRSINHAAGQPVSSMLLSLLHTFGVEVDSFQKRSEIMSGLNDSNYEHFVEKEIATYLKADGKSIILQGKLRMSSDIDKPRLHLMDIEGVGTVRIEIPFKSFNRLGLPVYCGKNVYLEGVGGKKSGEWKISDISKIKEFKG
jgi:hypothetical protein